MTETKKEIQALLAKVGEETSGRMVTLLQLVSAVKLLATAVSLMLEPEAEVPAIPRLLPRRALTPRDHEYGHLLVQGFTNSEIAARTGTTEQVVKNRFRDLYARVGVKSRAQFLIWWLAEAKKDQEAQGAQ